ncbi:YfhE family protein [Planococcus sp. NCCP-2050]|uniref:YfhE family protein n=1 Tax=Planococcus sp. NCCP-2050 TaxID=2944679 RepID=UPI0020400F1D|nr:YfhE family protein [Planococcus sp. NCCP-2050]GKW46375.1 hypothetical protein NCCP2050_20670 [Planococcus sp. NCCP-2050]
MAEEKQPHEKLADKELNVKAAQEVHYQEEFKKADKVAEDQKQDQDKTSDK